MPMPTDPIRYVALTAPQQIVIQEKADRPLAAQEVRVRTLHSGISAGTELTAYFGSTPHLHKQWDAERRIFVVGEQTGPAFPVENLGYEEVGQVTECGAEVQEVRVGQIVYGTWGHRTGHILDAASAQARLLPEGLDPILGIFSHIGSTALNGVHDAHIRIGDTVAVFGLGVLGQIVAQLASVCGARVIGVDLHGPRLALAQELGAIEQAIPAQPGGVAEQIRALTEGRGADVCIEVTGAAAALHEAIRSTAYSARVVAMGFYQGAAGGLFLGEEFHHNRIQVVCSQISGVAPEASYRWNRVRLAQTIMALQAKATLRLAPLISHRFPFEQAAAAFETVATRPLEAMQVVLDFGSDN